MKLRSKFLYIIFSLSVKNLKTILKYQMLKTWIILMNMHIIYIKPSYDNQTLNYVSISRLKYEVLPLNRF